MRKGIIAAFFSIAGAAVGALGASKVSEKKINVKAQLSDKHLSLFLLMNQWVRIKQQGKSVAEYLLSRGYQRIAIYGMSYVGETLYDELKDSRIEVVYAIDSKATGIYAEISILSPEEVLPEVDAIVVTPVFFFNEIVKKLSEKTNADILSIEDILYNL